MLDDKYYNVLLIEDSDDDIRAIERYCAKTTYVKTNLTTLKSLADVDQWVLNSPIPAELILLDLHLPDSSGLDTFFAVKKMLPNIPIVITTAYEDYNLAIQAMKEGAQDYIEKDRFDEYLLGRTIRHSIEREKIEAGLRSSLQQRKMLLKEVFHRVKNNLQIMSSLISLQILHCDVEEVTPILEDMQERIFSMSAIHEMLYTSDSMDSIDCHEYFNRLVGHISGALSSPDREIKVDYRVDPITLPIDYAISCGLIFTELVSNAFKHAFNEAESGIITVQFLKDESGHFFLTVSDNGCGLDADFEPENNPSSLGFKVILSQVDQIGGKFLFERSAAGSKFFVSFAI